MPAKPPTSKEGCSRLVGSGLALLQATEASRNVALAEYMELHFTSADRCPWSQGSRVVEGYHLHLFSVYHVPGICWSCETLEQQKQQIVLSPSQELTEGGKHLPVQMCNYGMTKSQREGKRQTAEQAGD